MQRTAVRYPEPQKIRGGPAKAKSFVVEDVEHVLLECRATRQTRRRILSRVHAQAQTNPQIRWATRGLSDDEIILATLGKPYHCRPGSKLHSALIGAAGPVWAREMKGLLY